jgi:arabinogalactan endo-1,4-beta-galactosidase
LWPSGNVNSNPKNTATLLHAASAGIKASSLTTKPQILIHLDNGWNYGTQQWWYDLVLKQGPLSSSDFDIQGVSYYPFYNQDATLASLKSSLTSMKSRYGKQVMVVETDWPTSCPNPAYSFPSDTKSIPFSAAGQSTWMSDVANAVTAAGGTGVFYWEPAWLDNANLGSSCANNLMFASNGQASSSLQIFSSI